ncbi:MAG: FadR/GntR family transcriptional regulator [Micromonosporaceae bacterium]
MALTDEAITKIKAMITSGELRPGDRLPKEVELAERLGLSRNPLREAVKALSLVGVLVVRQGDGTYVTSLEPRLLLDVMTFVGDFHRDDTMLHLLETRRILEPAASALAAQRMTDAEVTELGGVLDALERFDGDADVEALVDNDVEFHRQIALGAGNPVLCSLLDGLSGPTVRARIWRGLTQEGALARTREQHQAIYKAIVARQPEVARAWSTIHVTDVEEWLRSAT